jgi:hypothetical protein
MPKLEENNFNYYTQQWLQKIGYWWTLDSKGQYVDEHKCADVIAYHDHVFLPTITDLEKHIGLGMETLLQT